MQNQNVLVNTLSPEPNDFFNKSYNDITFGQNKVLIKFDEFSLIFKVTDRC